MEHKKISFWGKFNLFWKFKYQYYPRNFIVGILNLFKWGPVIWKDRDWDDSFFFEVMKFKISKMAKSHGAYMPYVGNKRNVEIMNLIVRLIDKFQDETYLHEYFDYVDEKIWFEKVEGAGYYNMKSEILKDDLDEYFQKYPLLKKQAEQHPFYKQNPDRVTLAISMGMIQHDKAKNLIFELMKRNVEKWWE
jgi:hypothetical protein